MAQTCESLGVNASGTHTLCFTTSSGLIFDNQDIDVFESPRFYEFVDRMKSREKQ